MQVSLASAHRQGRHPEFRAVSCQGPEGTGAGSTGRRGGAAHLVWLHGSTGDCVDLPFGSWGPGTFAVPLAFFASFLDCLWFLLLAIVR